MPLYSFACSQCAATETVRCTYDEFDALAPPVCSHGPMQRDYRSDRVGLGIAELKRERESGDLLARTFMPHADDFAGPTDPDGSKGLRKWKEEHAPAEGNKKPKWPSDPPGSKTTFALSSGKRTGDK